MDPPGFAEHGTESQGKSESQSPVEELKTKFTAASIICPGLVPKINIHSVILFCKKLIYEDGLCLQWKTINDLSVER